MKYPVFFISDSTAITTETLGLSLLAQFPGLEFNKYTLPFIDTPLKAQQTYELINQKSEQYGQKALIFSSMVQPELCQIIRQADALVLDLFEHYLTELEQFFHQTSTHAIGLARKPMAEESYNQRIAAVDFSMLSDDGTNLKHYKKADVILVGVSRSGKTPTCLYLALQYGIRAANYPLVAEDFLDTSLPHALKDYQDKLIGLTIDPGRLHAIRKERRSTRAYADPALCRQEVRYANQLFQRYNIPSLDTTHRSIEELSARIISLKGFKQNND
ncbi:phosphoenolpyruvate synthase regulatory protein [Piscirickettsia salmonis]|uniref:Putative phosphoenolpyruvate synthase regulatory protein n=1 Tax=Piscirickettsia salmonis TaxID=1238 RepID=A0A9Q6LQM7_PISSA|nr:pyruvate, water dikinase regulatory protein [Piscirickettsia salmonis]ALA26202.1 kinase/pyrophosphorylase family protein [Piscirickettsia salmonis]APS43643.1 phosphoenolpyruvate synthase regulatory protein [Piscirickettsia salmonis]APS46998.1 phosphoenolpyruvate synthase regulatory protein [Piscirickettsia salmonis]APS51553.1 phosphoenolpyruvate synthase regulatory protein [Piscirickettsia salmonis]APS54767.1 phosphoenolpyruvate synthase regulatory protein [Piscirickettsia salmonis]